MKKHSFIYTIALILIAYGCKHTPEALPTCVAGAGGNTTIVVYADHGETAVPNYYTHPDTAYVKFGTINSPGTNPADYDTNYVSEPGEDHIHCMGLKCGDYFVYRTAWDSVANITRYGGYGIGFSETSGEKAIHVQVN